jgi:hypothetical protein
MVCLLDVLKNDFDEIDKAMYESVERPYDINFCIVGIEKSYIYEVAYVLF